MLSSPDGGNKEITMKILSITNNSLENCQFSSVEISAQLKAWNQWRLSIRGALSRKSPAQGILKLYLLGRAKVVAGGGSISIKENKEYAVQYSVLSIPYSMSPSDLYQVSVLLDLDEPLLHENDPLASVYLGDRRISKELISSNVWENTIEIKSLKFQLLYPKILPVSYLRPTSQRIATSTVEETKNILIQHFGEEILAWGLRRWLVQNVEKNTPFVLRFPSIDEIVQEELDKIQVEDLKTKEKKEKKGFLSFLANLTRKL